MADAKKMPTVIVVIGMAGSGKTTLITSLHAHLSRPGIIDAEVTPSKMADLEPAFAAVVNQRPKQSVYVINLDPAVLGTPYPTNIDIRDTVKYKKVMKDYNLGPNGAILTSLNIFATKFDQVLKILDKRAETTDCVIIDTPGQIEAFNWSASGTIILESLAVQYPTVVMYVVDTPRCAQPVTFMSNMTYACSVLYKSKLPFILVLNKTDVADAAQCFKWMKSYDAFADAVVLEDTYIARLDLTAGKISSCSLSRSCALVMHEFYEGIKSVGVSAATRQGFVKLESLVNEARTEYFDDYVPLLEEQRKAVKERRSKLALEAQEKFTKDRADDKERKELEAFRRELKAKREADSSPDRKTAT